MDTLWALIRRWRHQADAERDQAIGVGVSQSIFDWANGYFRGMREAADDLESIVGKPPEDDVEDV